MIMATARKLPDLVNDSKLLVELHETHAHYFNICNNTTGQLRRRAWEKETWVRAKRLGGGATGEVWLEECHTGGKIGQVRAVKVISKSSHFDVYQELETIAKFSQNTSKYEGLFVKSLGWYENDISVFLVMEHIEHGSLASHLTHPLSEDEAGQITVQILEGLACFHENEFVHRDVKPDNILVASKNPEWWVKIGDFGFSKRTSEDNSLHSFVGTQKYFAPEVLGLLPQWVDPDTEPGSGYRCTYPMDMWSLGVMVFYMLCHDYPFQGNALLDYLRGSPFPIAQLSRQRISQAGCTFIVALLTVDPAKRLSAVAALRHPWLEGYQDEIPSAISETLPPVVRNRSVAHASVTVASASWPMSSTWDSNPTCREQALNSMGAISEPERLVAPRLEELHIGNSQQKTLDELGALHSSGLQLIADKNYSQAEDVFQQAADGRKTILGPHHKDRVESMQQLGVTYFFQRRYQDAQKKLQFAADVQTDTLGTTYASTLTSSYWLSSLYLAQGKFDTAQEIIERTMEIQKETLGLQNKDTLNSIHLCSQIHYQQEKYEDALELLEQAADSVLGNDHATILEVHQSLAVCLYKMKRYKEAQSVLEQIIQASPSALELAQLIDLLFDISQSLYEAEEYSDAQRSFEMVSEYRKDILGPAHEKAINSAQWVVSSLCKQPGKATQARDIIWQIMREPISQSTRQSVLDQLHDTGVTLCRHGAYTKSCNALQGALEGRKLLLGRRHQDTLFTASWLGHSFFRLERYGEATELLQSIRKDQLDTVGNDHLHTVYTRFWLGLSLHHQGQHKAAHSYIKPAYWMLRHKLGSNDEDVIVYLRCLGSSYSQVGNYAYAEDRLRQALPAVKRLFGPTHEETLKADLSLGIALYELKSYELALECFYRVSDVQNRTLGMAHEKAIATNYYIGVALDGLRRYRMSETVWKMVADGRRTLFGANHPETLDAMRSLAFSLARQDRRQEAVTLLEQVLKAAHEAPGLSPAAIIHAERDLKKCRKGGLAGKWALYRSEHMKLEFRGVL